MSEIFRSTRNTRTILENSMRFIRSDVPTAITSAECQWLKDNHVTTIIDLREKGECLERPCPLEKADGFHYLNLPITGGNAVPKSTSDVSLSYRNMVDSQMRHIIDTILLAKTHVLYFCSAGKDRTGVVSAILLHRLGYAHDYIIADYLKSAENLKEMLDNFANRHPTVDRAIITPQKAYMEEFLAWLEKRPSI